MQYKTLLFDIDDTLLDFRKDVISDQSAAAKVRPGRREK